ncbi:MAG: ABC transporter permease [Thermoguttaceae bacterium]|jgi:ABC-type antimicrobial peptide transport system permease subunit|nr:ABC transporter permease [Thermoguttaceae bacterium]MDI9444623.1 ABC transporter permease [Planctomycetota bacterium]
MAIPLIYSLRSVAVRKASSAMAVGGFALVVVVFVTLLSLGAGFRKIVESSGSPQNVLVLRKGADAELPSQVMLETARTISELPIVAEEEGRKLAVFESVLIVARPNRGGRESHVTIRGVPSHARSVHADVRLARGRWFTPGSSEAVLGVGLARRIRDVGLGQSITIGRDTWRIVGLFEAGGSSLESELWMDGDLLQTAFHRDGVFQSVLFRAAGDPQDAVRRLTALAESDPRLRSVQAMTEKEYYRRQAKLMADLITVLGGILTAIMSVGAIAGAMNTMYAAVSQRKREIGCLLAMGFAPRAIWLAFMVESLLLAGLGAALGCAASMAFDGMQTGMTNWATFSETAFEFAVTPGILAAAALVSVAMGFVGGVLPAFRAARMKVVDALRRA